MFSQWFCKVTSLSAFRFEVSKSNPLSVLTCACTICSLSISADYYSWILGWRVEVLYFLSRCACGLHVGRRGLSKKPISLGQLCMFVKRGCCPAKPAISWLGRVRACYFRQLRWSQPSEIITWPLSFVWPKGVVSINAINDLCKFSAGSYHGIHAMGHTRVVAQI